MKLERLRQPAIGAIAVLLISGAGIAFAGGSTSPAAPASAPTAAPIVAPAAVAPAQPAAPVAATTPDQPGVAEPVEPAGTDTDTLQQGDQTTPDVAGAAEAPEAAETGAEAPGAEADGPVGHTDADGADVNHEFDGEE